MGGGPWRGVVKLSGGDELRAPTFGVANFRFSCRADTAATNLDDALDVMHLGGTPHGARKSQTLAMPFVPPVDMGIDLKNGERPSIGKGFDERDRDRVVTADHQRHCA